ncbi:MAG: GNAT family N-acetyltransferase [Ignavibacteria bacterium]
MSLRIRQAVADDYAAGIHLLQQAQLPVAGIREHFENFLVAENAEGIVGMIGAELYADTALLRSAVVRPDHQSQGIGTLLYESLVTYLRGRDIQRVLLRTNTAEAYFAKKGFVRIARESVSGPVTQSVEFSGACPSHAACMELCL